MSPRPRFSLSRLFSANQQNHAGPRKAGEAIKSLPIVVLLTLMIWIYAENAQTRTDVIVLRPGFTVPDANLMATVLNPGDVEINLTGPRGQIEKFKSLVSAGDNEGRLKLSLDKQDGSTIGEHSVDIARALKADPRFQSLSIDIKASPPQFTVMVDRVIEHDFTVGLPLGMSVALKNVTFDPPRVIVRGPSPAINAQLGNASPLVLVDVTGLDTSATTGPRTLSIPLSLNPQADQRLTLLTPRVDMSFEVGSTIQTSIIRSVFVDVRRPGSEEGKSRVMFSRGPVIQNVQIRGPASLVNQYLGDLPEKPLRAVLQLKSEDNGQSGLIREVNFPDLDPLVQPIGGPYQVTFDVRDIGGNDR